MANNGNLKKLTSKEAREIGAKGGKASAEARRKKRDLRQAMVSRCYGRITIW